MMKLSKISKVIMLIGIIMAFSTSNVFAASDCEKQCSETYKGNRSQISACKAQCKADEANQKATNTQAAQDTAINDRWKQAQSTKEMTQNTYTDASVKYNTCVATKGANACQAEKKAMEDAKFDLDAANESYNDAQKDASKAYWENKKMQEKADAAAAKAEQKQLKADQKALKDAEKALKKCEKENGEGNCAAEESAVAEAQQKVDSHNQAVEGTSGEDAQLNALQNEFTSAGSDYGKQSDALNSMKNYSNELTVAAAAASAECTRYSAMTSQDARAKAKDACAQAEALKAQAEAAQSAYEEAKNAMADRPLSESVLAAQGRVKQGTKNDNSYGIVDIDEARQISMSGSDANSFAGYRSEKFNYDSGGDVLEKITRRAARVVVGLKPLVYIFAGFGLIGFAWAAIFNKLSWKWFANIAMGLFLVANMGRLIEYMVAGDGGTHYYIGVWDDGATPTGTKTDGANQLANAFKDSYYVYGDNVDRQTGLRMFELSAQGTDTEKVAEEFTASAAGFCQGTSGSGWANFTSCVKDVISTAKKAADTVKTTVAVAQDMKARVDTVKDTVSNITQAAKNMKGASLTEIVTNTGIILSNVNTAVSTTTGAIGSVTNAMSTISNNVQDMGKSVEQQKELQDRRNSGEATNAFDAMLKGQEWDASTGGVENVDGEWAGQSNFITTTNDLASDISDKSSQLNGLAQDGLMQVGVVTNAIESAPILPGGKSLYDKYADNKEQKVQQNRAQAQAAADQAYRESNAGKNEDYRAKSEQVSNMYNDMQKQEQEVKQLQNQKASAEKAVEQNCNGDNDTSPLCQASRNSLKAVEDSLQAKEEQLNKTKDEYDEAKRSMEHAYNEALDSNISKAEEDYEKAAKDADDICSKNPGSSECANARQKALDAANTLTSYVNEKENATGDSRYETSEDTANKLVSNEDEQKLKEMEKQLAYEQEQEANRLKHEAEIANSQYEQAMSEADALYSAVNSQEEQVKQLEQEAKNKQQNADKACATDPNSSLCATAREASSAANAALNNKKDQLEQTKNDYDAAKNKAEDAYQNALTANQNQAQRDLENAKEKSENAKATLDEVNSKIDGAKDDMNTAKDEYNQAMKDAQAAQDAYNQAVSSGANQSEINRLKREYENKLAEMSDKKDNYEEKNKEYNDLSKQKEQAQRDYNSAYSEANDAAGRLDSYTNEDINQTGDSRLTSSEDVANQILVNQYESETNPNAVAQASKNSYVEQKNKTDVAEYTKNEKEAAAKNAYNEYQKALQRCQQSGNPSDCQLADRLSSQYNLAASEAEAAKQEYESLNNELQGYESDYKRKALESEKYKQREYQADMQEASSDINKYERLVSQQRRVVDDAALRYTQAKNSLQEGDEAGLKLAAQLYDEYKEAKALYDDYQSKLNQARNRLSTAQSNYDKSVAEARRLEKELNG